MAGSFARRIVNRILHLMAQFLPGLNTVRPFLHRLRGVKIGKGVEIGEQVFIENDFPECIEIHDGVGIAARTNIIAHRLGPGRIIFEKNVFIGMGCNIGGSGGKTITIGEGAVVAMGSVVISDIPPFTFVAGNPAKPKSRVTIPLMTAKSMEEFKNGIRPLERE